MTDEEITQLRTMSWVECRLPIRDALVTFVPEGTDFPTERIPASYEQRWYPESDGGVRLMVPYDGGSYDSSVFHVEAGAWDHSTCDVCNARIPATTLCYVTEHEPYTGLCSTCYKQHVAQ